MKIIDSAIPICALVTSVCAEAAPAPQTTAVSTSVPTPIAWKDSKGNVNQTSAGKLLEAGNCYATIGVASVHVYAHTDWWKAIWNTDAVVYATTKLTGRSSGNINVTDTRVGTPRPIKTGDTVDDMGLTALFLDAVPWDFANLHLDLAINSSADSMVRQIASGVATVSKGMPGVQLSAALNGGLTAAQVIDKLLLDQSRTTARLSGSFDLVAVGKETLHTGCYVVFGSDKSTDYQKYLVTDAGGTSQLVWDNGHLTFRGNPVSDVTYFIITVESQNARFPNADSAPLNSQRSWAAPLQNAELSIEMLAFATDVAARNTAISAIKADITKGQTLLLADPDILVAEKKAIVRGVSERLAAALANATVKAEAMTRPTAALSKMNGHPGELLGSKNFVDLYSKASETEFSSGVDAGKGATFVAKYAPINKADLQGILNELAEALNARDDNAALRAIAAPVVPNPQ